VEYPGAIYHVTSRGNARSDIYLDDADRETFLTTLSEVVSRFGWVCHAYCLMSNHYHLIIETPKPNLAQGMRQLNGVYTQRFNRAHHRVGHVFQGRYKAILVERDAYLLELSRYVVLNPVRAGMVDDAGDWPWSSYRATAGMAACPSWLSIEWLLDQFGGGKKRRVDRYVRFVAEGAGARIWDSLKHQVYLGSDDFVDEIKRGVSEAGQWPETPREQWKPSGKSLEEYASLHEDRGEAMARAYLEGGFRMKEIAGHFGVHYATVSRAVRKWERNA
jgi:REP element-mobilizing transposase RayT